MKTIVISSSVGCILGVGVLFFGLRMVERSPGEQRSYSEEMSARRPNRDVRPTRVPQNLPDLRNAQETARNRVLPDSAGLEKPPSDAQMGEEDEEIELSPEEEDARSDYLARKEIERALDEFDSEEIDVEWSKSASQSIGSDIALALEQSTSTGTLESVRCKSQRCIATVVWPSLSEAKRQHTTIAKGDMSENCIVSSFIPGSAEETDAGYEHNIFFNCRPKDV